MDSRWDRARRALVTTGLALLTGCIASTGTDDQGEGEVPVASVEAALIGDHLRGIDDDEFAEALAAFSSEEEFDDGVGPVFNDVGCANCHSFGAVGGASDIIERRFGRVRKGKFDPLANRGGSLRQLQTIGDFVNEDGDACSVPLEVEPREATVRNVGRLTTPLFGLGLVDALPDSTFKQLADSQPSSVRGVVSMVRILLPDPRDPTQSLGAERVGRFGWKGTVPNLTQFSADAYLNEMAITTQHCIDGESVTAFATEPAPNGVPVDQACEDGIPGVDEAVGDCAPGQTEIQDDVAEFNTFMTFLAPPARERDNSDLTADDYDAPEGRKLFDITGCSNCHIRQGFVTPRRPANGVPGRTRFFPFSDFLLHDMGRLGDEIGNAGDSVAITRLMRTAPLWGIRFRTKLLHDGRASDIPSAVAEHDGQGADAAKAFRKLARSKQRKLVDFVRSL